LRDQVMRSDFPNGISTAFTYDALGRVTSVASGNGSAPLSSISYQYDGADRLIRTTGPGGAATQYTYDPLARLISSTMNGQTTSFTYDANGNRLTAGATAFTYDAGNRMIRAGASMLEYDKNGNLTSDGARTYAYDAYNRLTGVSGGGVSATYTFGGDGNRVRAGKVSFLNNELNGMPLIQTGADGDTVYLRGAGLISAKRAGSTLYYQGGAIGNVVAVSR